LRGWSSDWSRLSWFRERGVVYLADVMPFSGPGKVDQEREGNATKYEDMRWECWPTLRNTRFWVPSLVLSATRQVDDLYFGWILGWRSQRLCG